MNLRQMQRTVAEVISKCQQIHVQLPVDPFDGMLSAGEALRHSHVGGKYNVDEAVDELKQRYGLEPKWQQLEDASEARRRSSQKRRRLHRGDEPADVAGKPSAATRADNTSDSESAEAASPSDSAVQYAKKPRPSATKTSPKSRGSSRIERIIKNNPAKNPDNEELAEEFVELGGYELEHGEKQKGISRMAVAKQIREAEETIRSGAQARHFPHVGPSAAKKIDEVLQRGKMKALEGYEAEKEAEDTKPGDQHSAETEEDSTQQQSERSTKGVKSEAKREGIQENEEDEDEDNDDEDNDEEEDDGEEPEDERDEDWQDDEEDEDGD